LPKLTLPSLSSLPFSRAELDAVLSPFEHASPLPPLAYLDPRVFAFEREAIFDREWLCIGREDEIEHPGAWMLAPLGGAGVLVARGPDLVCRAFHNVCRHRAAPLAFGPRGRCNALRCPYHGWTYELSGALREAPHTASLSGFDPKEHGLLPVRVEAWRGFLFVNLDPSAPPLAAHIGAPPERIARAGLLQLRLGRRVEYTTMANWKLLIENFQESHHFPGVHPELEHFTPTARAESVLTDGPWLGGIMDIIDEAETVSLDGRRNHRPLLAGTSPDDERRVFDAMLFPNLLLSLQPDYLLTYRLWPLGPAETKVVADIYFHPAAFTPGFDPSGVYAFWDRVNAQDRTICERQQVGLGTRGYRPSRYTSVEDGVHAFDRMVARRYEAALKESA